MAFSVDWSEGTCHRKRGLEDGGLETLITFLCVHTSTTKHPSPRSTWWERSSCLGISHTLGCTNGVSHHEGPSNLVVDRLIGQQQPEGGFYLLVLLGLYRSSNSTSGGHSSHQGQWKGTVGLAQPPLVQSVGTTESTQYSVPSCSQYQGWVWERAERPHRLPPQRGGDNRWVLFSLWMFTFIVFTCTMFSSAVNTCISLSFQCWSFSFFFCTLSFYYLILPA